MPPGMALSIRPAGHVREGMADCQDPQTKSEDSTHNCWCDCLSYYCLPPNCSDILFMVCRLDNCIKRCNVWGFKQCGTRSYIYTRQSLQLFPWGSGLCETFKCDSQQPLFVSINLRQYMYYVLSKWQEWVGVCVDPRRQNQWRTEPRCWVTGQYPKEKSFFFLKNVHYLNCLQQIKIIYKNIQRLSVDLTRTGKGEVINSIIWARNAVVGGHYL